MKKLNPRKSVFAVTLATAFLTLNAQMASQAQAAIAQQPLLTKSSSVDPNVLLIFDDSGSMNANYLYQYGSGASSGMGNQGPSGDSDYFSQSPNVNRIHYDPRVLYKPRVNAQGEPVYIPNQSGRASWYVYFYKRTSASTTPSIWDGKRDALDAGEYTSYFRPSYTPSAFELAAGASVIAYPNNPNRKITQYPKFLARTDCASAYCTWAEELNNYSIWENFHASRMAMAKTGVSRSFMNFGPTLRVGWAALSTIGYGDGLDAGVYRFNETTRKNFYDWLGGLSATSGTPSLQALNYAGQYFSRSDSDGPWGTSPSPSSTSIASPNSVTSKEKKTDHATCRRSYTLYITDGYYNAPPYGSIDIGNSDGSEGPEISLPGGATWRYKPDNYPLLKDTYSNTMADIAMYYWNHDLRKDLSNDITPTANDVSQWQNMHFYGINLGVYGSLPFGQDTLNQIKAGKLNWPKPAANGLTAMDDMWHATLNGHGQLLDAANADGLQSSLQQMLTTINKLNATMAGVAVSTASLQAGTRKYIPRYITGSWTGNLLAKNLDVTTGYEIGTEWQVENENEGDVAKASSGIPNTSSRMILVGTSSSSTSKAVSFDYPTLNSNGLLNHLDSNIRNSDAINYFRGDDSKEQQKGDFRARSRRLGDIVNSTPIFIKGQPFRENSITQSNNSPKLLAVQTSLAGSGKEYIDYLSNLSKRNEGVIFVGANDGIFHGFRDGTPSTPLDGGKEVFAYVPFGSLPTLHLLTNPNYAHQYYVDGPSVETDGYWDGAWRQVLLGSAGAGAKSIFAFDVTSPLNMNANKVLWENTPATTGFSNLGYNLWDLQSGPLNSNQWAALVGNGYESEIGTASLLILNLKTGALIKELSTGSGSWKTTVGKDTLTHKNALGGVSIVKDAIAQRIVGAYAGDLKGNVWRFDLSDPNPNNWKVSLLFNTGQATASVTLPSGVPKPITAPPTWVKNPAGGRIVVVGTGKFIEDSDVPAPYSTQTLYGIADMKDFNGSTAPTTVSATSLVPRILSSIPNYPGFLQLNDINGNAPGVIDWSTHSGWYIDLPFTGQRMTYPMDRLLNRNSRVVAIDTISPANVSTNPCKQTGSGTGWSLFIDALYGADPGRPTDLRDIPFNSILKIDGANPSVYAMGKDAKADGRNITLKVGESSTSDGTVKLVTLSGDSSGSTETNISCQLLGNCHQKGPSLVKRRTITPLFLRMK